MASSGEVIVVGVFVVEGLEGGWGGGGERERDSWWVVAWKG